MDSDPGPEVVGRKEMKNIITPTVHYLMATGWFFMEDLQDPEFKNIVASFVLAQTLPNVLQQVLKDGVLPDQLRAYVAYYLEQLNGAAVRIAAAMESQPRPEGHMPNDLGLYDSETFKPSNN